jgi:hypothetical protein
MKPWDVNKDTTQGAELPLWLAIDENEEISV